ncbi:MAG: methyltransferase family protein [Candidatus Thorarchaeota archaeon]
MESIHKRGVSKEHPKGHLIQLAVGFIFFLIWILDSFIFMFSTILANYISFFIRLILFLSFLIIGFFLIFRTGHILFHKEDTSSKLIKTGIFAHTRHPLYLGVLIVYIGFILLTISMLSIVGFIIVFILYDRIATFEEKELEKSFQEEYVEYKRHVSKWIPIFKKR